MSDVAEEHQTQLLDTTGKNFNAYWVDEKQDLFIPNDPLHFKAHKLQILLGVLLKQAERNGAQFNSKNFLDTLNEYTKCVEAIKDGRSTVDEGEVVNVGNNGTTPEMGIPTPPSLDSGISADNPLAG